MSGKRGQEAAAKDEQAQTQETAEADQAPTSEEVKPAIKRSSGHAVLSNGFG